jgi:hypothetical protein
MKGDVICPNEYRPFSYVTIYTNRAQKETTHPSQYSARYTMQAHENTTNAFTSPRTRNSDDKHVKSLPRWGLPHHMEVSGTRLCPSDRAIPLHYAAHLASLLLGLHLVITLDSLGIGRWGVGLGAVTASLAAAAGASTLTLMLLLMLLLLSLRLVGLLRGRAVVLGLGGARLRRRLVSGLHEDVGDAAALSTVVRLQALVFAIRIRRARNNVPGVEKTGYIA